MRAFFKLSFFVAFFFFSLNFAYANSTPLCIQQKIRLPEWNGKGDLANRVPPISIDEYDYKGKKTYLIAELCADCYTNLVDSKCAKICAPMGGFGGQGDGKCLDFSKKSKYIRSLWPKDRATTQKVMP